MRRSFLVLAALLALAVSLPVAAQAPTAEQLELLRSLSPEDREALMEQLGIGSGTVITESGTGTGDERQRRERTGRESEALARSEQLLSERTAADKALKPDDSVLIDIDFIKDKPPRIEQGAPGTQPITIPGEPAPLPEERPGEDDEDES